MSKSTLTFVAVTAVSIALIATTSFPAYAQQTKPKPTAEETKEKVTPPAINKELEKAYAVTKNQREILINNNLAKIEKLPKKIKTQIGYAKEKSDTEYKEYEGYLKMAKEEVGTKTRASQRILEMMIRRKKIPEGTSLDGYIELIKKLRRDRVTKYEQKLIKIKKDFELKKKEIIKDYEDTKNQYLKENEAISSHSKVLPPLTLKVGSIGKLMSWNSIGIYSFKYDALAFKSYQIIDESNLLAKIGNTIVWLEGFDTKGMVDNENYKYDKPLKVVGTKKYDLVKGGTKTVYHIKKYVVK